MVSILDRVALLLATKEEGKAVDLDHVFEKVSRDTSFLEHRAVSKSDVEEALNLLVAKGLASKTGDGYVKMPAIDRVVSEIVERAGGELNRSYMLVWIAKKYYPRVAGLMLPFLEGRAVSAVKIFSGKRNPIKELDTIFVRYVRWKPKPINLTVSSEKDLLRLVDDHCVDFIPYVHRMGVKEPDVFVLDLDAGEGLLRYESAFELIRFTTSRLAELLMELGVKPMVKFSGSRGFQIWAFLDNSKLELEEDMFAKYRELAVKVQRLLESRLQEEYGGIKDRFPELVEEGRPITTSVVARKEERAYQILIDWSAMKPSGDVRAPFSIHYKTGLVSLPLTLRQLEEFRIEDAAPLKVAEHIDIYRSAAEIHISDPSRLRGI